MREKIRGGGLVETLRGTIEQLEERRVILAESITTLQRVIDIEGGAAPAPATRRGRPARVAATNGDGDTPDLLTRALQVVRKAGKKGIIGSQLLSSIDAPSAYGLGSLKAALQDRLRDAHRSELLDSAVREERKGRGFMWYPGEAIEEAIEILEDAAS